VWKDTIFAIAKKKRWKMIEKKQLRQELLQARKKLSQQEWHSKSQALCEQLRQYLDDSPVVFPGGTILNYFYFRNEPNLDPLFELRDYYWGVPRCVENELSWHFWQPGDPLVKGAFGIREPLPEAPTCSPEAVDLIFVPAVACDSRGYRLGYGGGFYDRLFHQPQWQHIPKIGIIFDVTFVPDLPADSWDIPLDGVCTDEGWRVKPPHL
jgi:5-formyltetrahydrofolate cyclo-ligase